MRSCSCYRLLLSVLMLSFLTQVTTFAQWKPTNGPWGGNITAITTYETTQYVATATGLFRSNDNANSWTAIPVGKLNDIEANAWKISAIWANGKTIILGTTQPTYYTGLLISTDNGDSWNEASINLAPGFYANSIGSLLQVNDTLLAMGNNGMLRSTNNGALWDTVAVGLSAPFLARCGSALIAGGDKGIFRSTDHGAAWKQTNNGLTNKKVSALIANNTTIFAGTSGGGLFRSTDSGDSWIAINTGLTDSIITSLTLHGASIFAGTSSKGIFRSTDNGEVWAPVNSDVAVIGVNALATNGTALFAATFSGIFISNDNGTTWTPRNNGIMGLSVGYLATNDNQIYAIGGYSGLFRSSNGGTNWITTDTTARNYHSQHYIHNLIADDSIIYTIEDYGDSSRIIYSDDNGMTFKPIKNKELPTPTPVNLHTVLFASGNILFASAYNKGLYTGLYRSIDKGATWERVSLGIKDSTAIVNQVSKVGTTLFVCTTLPYKLLKSTDNGETWVDLNISAYGVLGKITAIGDTLFMPSSDVVYRSTDDGHSWAEMRNGLEGKPIDPYSFAVYRTTLYVGTSGKGVFRSIDYGKSWKSMNIGHQDWFRARSLVVHNSTLFAGTDAGVWKYELTTSVEEQSPNVGLAIFPNPASDNFTVRCTNAGTLTVRDVLGRVRGYEIQCTDGEATIPTIDLPAGVYFIELIGKNGSKVVEKVVVSR